MPRATSRRPKRIKLFWGLDQLEVDDPYWIEKIVQEMPKYRQHAEDLGPRLLEPYSRLNESIGASSLSELRISRSNGRNAAGCTAPRGTELQWIQTG